MQEDKLIDFVTAQAGKQEESVVGIGDDCCIWQAEGQQCLSVDSIVEGVHFTIEDASALVGRKAAATALSDLAAMGARPIGAVVALQCPAHRDPNELMTGLLEELQRHDCALLGGDTTASDQLVISVTVWGKPAPSGRLLTRSGGESSDLLVVTGALGGSLENGRHLRPPVRLIEGEWLAQESAVRAMMDLSDGLASDAPKLAKASGMGCLLLPDRVPIHADVPARSYSEQRACCDGEDFELLFAIESTFWPELQAKWPFNLSITVVGWLLDEPGTWCEGPSGQLQPFPWSGYEHKS